MATISQRVAESKLLSAVNWFEICADRHLGLQSLFPSWLLEYSKGLSPFLSKHVFLSSTMQTQVGTASALKYQPTITETWNAQCPCLHDGSAFSYGTSTCIWVFFHRKSYTQPECLDRVLWCTLLRQEAARRPRPAWARQENLATNNHESNKQEVLTQLSLFLDVSRNRSRKKKWGYQRDVLTISRKGV